MIMFVKIKTIWLIFTQTNVLIATSRGISNFRGEIHREDIGISLVSFYNSDSSKILSQHLNIQAKGYQIDDSDSSSFTRIKKNEEIIILPENSVTKIFKTNLKKKILYEDCKI